MPQRVTDSESYRSWKDNGDFSDPVRVDYIGGKVCVDVNRERIFTHPKELATVNRANGRDDSVSTRGDPRPR